MIKAFDICMKIKEPRPYKKRGSSLTKKNLQYLFNDQFCKSRNLIFS